MSALYRYNPILPLPVIVYFLLFTSFFEKINGIVLLSCIFEPIVIILVFVSIFFKNVKVLREIISNYSAITIIDLTPTL